MVMSAGGWKWGRVVMFGAENGVMSLPLWLVRRGKLANYRGGRLRGEPLTVFCIARRATHRLP